MRVKCDLDAIDEPSILKLTRIAVALVRMLPTLDLSWVWKAARRADSCKSPKKDFFLFIMRRYSESLRECLHMSVGVMRDYKLMLRDLHASHALGWRKKVSVRELLL